MWNQVKMRRKLVNIFLYIYMYFKIQFSLREAEIGYMIKNWIFCSLIERCRTIMNLRVKVQLILCYRNINSTRNNNYVSVIKHFPLYLADCQGPLPHSSSIYWRYTSASRNTWTWCFDEPHDDDDSDDDNVYPRITYEKTHNNPMWHTARTHIHM